MATLTNAIETASYTLTGSSWLDEFGNGALFADGDNIFISGPSALTFSPDPTGLANPEINALLFGPAATSVTIGGGSVQITDSIVSFNGSGVNMTMTSELGFGGTGSLSLGGTVALDITADITESGTISVGGFLRTRFENPADVLFTANGAELEVRGAMTGGVSTVAGLSEVSIEVDLGGSITSFNAIQSSAGVTNIDNAGTITGLITLEDGDDVLLNRGTITGVVDMGDGDNDVSMTSNAVITGDLSFGSGADILLLNHNTQISGAVDFGGGIDTVTTSGFGPGSITVGGPIRMGAGDDSFSGTASNKGFQIDGGADDDTIVGSFAGDRIAGGSGTNTLSGNSGTDTFVFNVTSGSTTINDYTANETIEIRGLMGADYYVQLISALELDLSDMAGTARGNATRQAVALEVTQDGGDAVLEFASGIGFSLSARDAFAFSIRLKNFNATSFDPDMLSFVTSETALDFV